MKNVYILIILMVAVVSFVIPSAYADTKQPTYTSLSPIPGLTSSNVQLATSGNQSGRGLTLYIQNLYIWGVALTSGLAVLVIMWGGIGYMTSAGGSGVEEAKGRISAAIMGLLLALGSYIILQTINKDLLDTSFELKEITVKGGSGGTSATTGTYVTTTGTTPTGTPGTVTIDGVVYATGPGTDIGGGTVSIDFDGSPGAYKVVEDPNGNYTINGVRYSSVGYENLSNAMSDKGKWVGVKTDSNGQPIIGSDGTLTGVLSYGNGSVNGDTTAFVALSTSQVDAARATNPNFKLGDTVYLTANGQTIQAIYADNALSRPNNFSEISPAAARALGIPFTNNSATGSVRISIP